MKTCKMCGMPDTRPGTKFFGGVCLACINYENRGNIDYKSRKSDLENLCKRRIDQKEKYDCVCAVSGGKDSTYIVHELVKLGMNPLLVTVCDEFTKTCAGIHNIKNISDRFNLDHISFRCSPQTFIKNTKNDFVRTLHPLKWIEEQIYNVPVEIAKRYDIPLVFFGENSSYEYGTVEILGTKHSLSDEKTSVYFFFSFFPYNEYEVMEKSKFLGFRDLEYYGEWFRQGNVENYSQIDSIGYIIQLWTKFPKYGFQRVSDMTSRMVRKGQLTLEQAKLLVKERDYICDPTAKIDFCRTIGISEEYFDSVVDKHANRDILVKDVNGQWRRKDLI